MAITPRARSASPSAASLLKAPRSLKELVTCRFSYLTKTSAPVSAESFGAGSIGVRSRCPAMVRRAATMSATVTLMLRLPPGRMRPDRAPSPQIDRASCLKTVYSPFAEGFDADDDSRERRHDRQRTEKDRRVDRAQAPRL